MPQNQTLPDKANRIHEGLKEKSFGIKDIKKFDKDAVRQLRYWITLGLLNENMNNAVGQDKFDFYEFIWILIIKELKELNFDNDILKKCAEVIFSRMDRNHKMLEFEKAVLYAAINRKDTFFVINKRGELEVYRPNDLTKLANKERFETCVIMNLLPLIKGFLYLVDFIDYVAERELLKENEIKALQLLHASNKATVKIEVGNKKITIEAGKDAAKEFINSIFTHDYKTLSIQF